jgi:hypothetical protein
MTPEDVDTPFARWVREQVERAGGYRKAAEQAGLAHGTFVKMIAGGTVNLSTIKSLAKWRGVSLIYLLRLYGEEIPEDNKVELTLARVLDARPELRETLEAAIDVLDDEELAEVIRFVQFQIDRNR